MHEGVHFGATRMPDGTWTLCSERLAQTGFASYLELETFVWDALRVVGRIS